MAQSCGHNHSHAKTSTKLQRNLLVVLLLTGVFMLVESIGGWWTGSLALLTDAGHMFSDTASLCLSLIAVRLSLRPATVQKSYGYQRAEVIVAFLNAVILLALSAIIMAEGIERWQNPRTILSLPALGIAVGGLMINLIGMKILHSSKHENLSVRGAYLHLLGDLLGSFAATSSALVIHFWGWTKADILVSFFIALLIVASSLRLFWDTLHILMQGTPSDCDIPSVKETLLKIPGVTKVSHLHIWCLGSQYRVASVHLCIRNVQEIFSIQDQVRKLLHDLCHVEHPTIQIDPQ